MKQFLSQAAGFSVLEFVIREWLNTSWYCEIQILGCGWRSGRLEKWNLSGREGGQAFCQSQRLACMYKKMKEGGGAAHGGDGHREAESGPGWAVGPCEHRQVQ